MRGLWVKSLLPALLCASLLAQPIVALAGVPADGVQQMDKAAEAFVALLKEPAAKDSPPRLTDPTAKPILDALLDRATILGEAPYKAEDIQPLLGIFSGYFTLTKVYMDFRDPAGKQNFADNDVLYQDELARLAVLMVEASGALSQALADGVARAKPEELTDARKSELAKQRGGISQMFLGALTLLQNPRYSKENKVLLAQALAANARAYRDIIVVSDRAGMVKTATETMLQTPPEAEADMNAFLNAMQSEECAGLCALK